MLYGQQFRIEYEDLWCEVEDVGNEERFPMMRQCFWLNACFLRGWLTAEKPKVDWGAGIYLWKTERGWKWVCVYVLPGHAWCMLMANACVHWAAVHASVCSGTSLLCASASVCLFYFPCCLTCGWLIAFRVRTGPGAWLSSQPPWGRCLDCACDRVCVCMKGGWKVFDPSYLQHPGVFVFTATAQPQWWRHVTLGGVFHINPSHVNQCRLPTIHPLPGTDNKHMTLLIP